jgi:hypothetical protein
MIAFAIALLLFALSAWCKAAMDTRVFQSPDKAFARTPDWFRKWMQTRVKIPVIKIDDGWHSMQALMFLFIGVGYLLCGTQFEHYGYWILLSIPARTLVHGVVFELVYPMT